MDIEDVKSARTKLEDSIRDMIAAFQRDTGAHVADIRLEEEKISLGQTGPGPIQYAYGQLRVVVAISI